MELSGHPTVIPTLDKSTVLSRNLAAESGLLGAELLEALLDNQGVFLDSLDIFGPEAERADLRLADLVQRGIANECVAGADVEVGHVHDGDLLFFRQTDGDLLQPLKEGVALLRNVEAVVSAGHRLTGLAAHPVPDLLARGPIAQVNVHVDQTGRHDHPAAIERAIRRARLRPDAEDATILQPEVGLLVDGLRWVDDRPARCEGGVCLC